MANERTTPAPLSQLQDELRLIGEEIEQARRAAEEFRSLIGQHAEGATDLSDRSAAIAQAEQQEELLGILTTRHEKVQERIRTFSGTGR